MAAATSLSVSAFADFDFSQRSVYLKRTTVNARALTTEL